MGHNEACEALTRRREREGLNFVFIAEMAKESEHSYVADAQNWEQRVKSELDAAKVWKDNWGPLFAPDAPKTYEDQINKLLSKAEEFKGAKLRTNNESYGVGEPFKEISTRTEKINKDKL